ncbi:RxLR effector protein [Phytophthora megakarya]|uniref:RxLR effector protein n=1 Tax=Phytophthora megakarya TaxID=4795 RepID=A0A225X0F3_9STRA|nr:RxLR effector protein [Phytophthora megakarya]
MRACYVFLVAAMSVLTASDATSVRKTAVSNGVLPAQVSAGMGRSLRVQDVIDNDEERTGADVKALVKKLLNIGASKTESFHISDDLEFLKQVETKIYQKEAKMVDGLIDQGWTPEKMDDMLTKPSFLQSIKDNDISDEGVEILRALMKAKYKPEN